MEEATTVRGAVAEAVQDVVPTELQGHIVRFTQKGTLAPGVITLVAAETLGEEPLESVEQVTQRAAGVQLIYDGLRLTRRLVTEEGWDGPETLDIDMCVLAADVMVARGFYVLARSPAATRAVEVVRRFGRNETRIRAGETGYRTRLEADVLALALVAGATSVNRELEETTIGELREARGEQAGFPEADRLVAEVRSALGAITDGSVEQTP